MNPLSIILPVYNGADYVSIAIESIRSQSHRDFELLILDDGSTDKTLEILNKYKKKDNRIKVFSRENRGLGASLTELINLSSYELIARMDADDIAYPNRIHDQLNHLVNRKDLVLIGGQISFLTGNQIYPAFEMPEDHEEILRGLLQKRFPICHPAIMFRKSAAAKVGFYRVNGAGEDLDFFLRMSEVGRISNIPSMVLQYRLSTNSLSSRRSNDLSIAYSMAVYNYKQRKAGLPEMEYEQFKIIRSKNKLGNLIKQKIEQVSENFYRRHFIKKSTGNLLLAYAYLIISASLRPRATTERMSQMIFKKNTLRRRNSKNRYY